jgi:hypothetical protein
MLLYGFALIGHRDSFTMTAVRVVIDAKDETMYTYLGSQKYTWKAPGHIRDSLVHPNPCVVISVRQKLKSPNQA